MRTPSANFNAGLDSSDVTLGYYREADWGVARSASVNLVRLRSEGFAGSKSRARPDEIRAEGDAAQAITQSVEASGSMAGLLSYRTYDGFLAALLNDDGVDEWRAPTLTAGSTQNQRITVAPGSAQGTGTFSLGGGRPFRDFEIGTIIRVSAFDQDDNNGVYRITGKTGNDRSITVARYDLSSDDTALVAQSGAGREDADNPAGVITAFPFIRNGSDVNTFRVEKKLASNLFLVYPGSYITGGGIATNQGSFAEVNFDFLCKEELKATATIGGNNAVVPANDGRVFDTVNGLDGFRMLSGGTEVSGLILQSVAWNITKEGARQQFGIGNVGALGMGRGTVTGSGTLTTYFKDFSVYDFFVSEAPSFISYAVREAHGTTNSGYLVELAAATITNPSVTAGGPDTDLVADFELEMNPAVGGTFDGITIQITRFADLDDVGIAPPGA